jgi:TonB family protein
VHSKLNAMARLDLSTLLSSGSLRAVLLLCTALSAVGATTDPGEANTSVKKITADSPDLLSCSQRVYPLESRRNEEQGTATVRFVVDTTGRVEAAEIIQSSRFPRLDEATLSYVRSCAFRPPSESKALVADFRWKLD